MIKVDVIGMKEANAALKKLPKFARQRVQPVMTDTAQAVAEGAKSRVPVRTGMLKFNIGWESRPRTLSAVVGAQKQGFYWKFLEYGTVTMEAKPSFRPAAEDVKDSHQDRLIEALSRAADDIAREAR